MSDVDRARELLHVAAESANRLEQSVRDLVSMRAWEVLGYENFAAMWKAETGLDCPRYVKVLAVCAMSDEGMNTVSGRHVQLGEQHSGHTQSDVARAIGFGVQENGKTGTSPGVSSILRQHNAGVPVQEIRPQARNAGDIIAKHTGRTRPKPRRTGKGPDDVVSESFGIHRKFVTEIEDIARKADVPKAELYRQAVMQFLGRHG